MVRNRYGEVKVRRMSIDGTDTFAEIKVTDCVDDVVDVWISKEEVSKLIWKLQKLLVDDMKFNNQKLTNEDFPTHLAPKNLWLVLSGMIRRNR